jgi:hypothetical protein
MLLVSRLSRICYLLFCCYSCCYYVAVIFALSLRRFSLVCVPSFSSPNSRTMVSASPQLFGVRRPTVPRGHLNPFNIFLVKLHSLSYLLFRLSITSSTNTASSMNPQSTPQELQAARSPSSYRSRASTFRQHASQYKWLICFLAGVIILIMAIGLLFVAHQYYHEFGGQGWLKVRDKSQEQEDVFARNLFLPLKKRKGWITDLQRRSPEDEVPFYQCGDQENSCEAYNQPVGADLEI